MSKATWFGHCDYGNGEGNVVLKILYNSSDNILDILKEVNKKKFNINVNIDLSILLNKIQLGIELIKISYELKKIVLCKDCKEKRIERLINECGNEEMARLLYECKLSNKYHDYIRWIPFNEFKNIKYLAKGGSGEVSKATWVG